MGNLRFLLKSSILFAKFCFADCIQETLVSKWQRFLRGTRWTQTETRKTTVCYHFTFKPKVHLSCDEDAENTVNYYLKLIHKISSDEVDLLFFLDGKPFAKKTQLKWIG